MKIFLILAGMMIIAGTAWALPGDSISPYPDCIVSMDCPRPIIPIMPVDDPKSFMKTDPKIMEKLDNIIKLLEESKFPECKENHTESGLIQWWTIPMPGLLWADVEAQ